MKRAKQIDWDKKQAIEKSFKKQKELQKKIEQIREDLDKAIKELEKNNLISADILEKYTKLQELFRDVISPELMQSLQKLQDALQKPNPKDVKQALQNFKLNQEAFEKNIERTMELLKRVQFEQQMDQLVQKAEALLKQQQKINQEIGDKQEQQDIEQLHQQQQRQKESLGQDIERFKKQELLEQFPKVRQEIDSASGQLKSQSLKQDLNDFTINMQQGQMDQAAQNSEKLEEQFEDVHQKLEQAQNEMMQQGKQMIGNKMQRISQQLLELSFEQERIQNETQETSALASNFNSILRDQGHTLDNFGKVVRNISALSRETFFLQPQITSALRRAEQKMRKSIGQLSERSKGPATKSQTEAMQALNESVISMNQSRGQMMQSQSGTGFEQFLKQMQQMAAQQGQINAQSLNLMQGQGNQGMFSQQELGQLKRLGSGQAALRQALDELSGQMGQRDDILGELDHIGQQMEHVEKDLLRGHLDRKTVERQRQILSRMLDSQRSLEQKEYSKKRKAEQAKYFTRKDPGDQGPGLDMDKKEIEQAMRRALNQGYTKDYQKLIRIYFEKLLRLNDAAE